MSRILGILNAYDHRNRGDRAIIEAQIAWLANKVPDAHFRVFSPAWAANEEAFGPEVSRRPVICTEEGQNALSNIVRPIGATLRAAHGIGRGNSDFDACDAYFLCGGGYLYSSTARGLSRQLWMHAGNSLLASGTGKAVMQFPQSWGPIRKAADAWICRRLAEALPCICSRGEVSTSLLRGWGFGEKTIEVPDVVVAMAELRPDLIQRLPEGDGELGVAPIDFGFARRRTNADLETYLDRVERVAASYIAEGGKGVVLFPQVQVEGSDEDLPVVRELARRFGQRGLPHRLVEKASWEGYFAEVSRMSVFLGSRMHACIFALISGVPTVGLAYQPKFEALFGQLEMADRCVPITDFDADQVADQIGVLAASSEARGEVSKAIDLLSERTLGGLEECWLRSGCRRLEPG